MGDGQIIAMGGGSIWASTHAAMDDYILSHARCLRPRVCFLGTASGDKPETIVKFYAAYSHRNCRPSHLPLFARTPMDLLDTLQEQDIIFVGGGNTRSMMATWKGWDLGNCLRQAFDNGTLLCGYSAGAICWFEQGLTDAIADRYTTVEGLGFLKGSVAPHFDSEPGRQTAYAELIAGGEMQEGYGIDERAALHFVGSELVRTISEAPGASVHRNIRTVDGVTVETLVPEQIS